MVIIDNGALLNEFRSLISNAYIQVFLWLVLADIVSGITKGLAGKQGDSTKGLLGLVKHILVVCLVLVAYPYLKILGFETIATGFVWSYIAVYLISLSENWVQLGLPFPNYVKNLLKKVKDEEEQQDKE